MALTIYLLSVVLVFTLYQATDAGQWRRVTDAVLADSEGDSYTQDTESISDQTLADCNSSCVDYGCQSFAYESTTQTCNLYPTRFGFDGTYLIPSSGDWIYYDRPTGFVDDLGDQIRDRIETVGYNSFLAWFRSGIPGRVSIDESSSSDLEIMVEYSDVDSADDCAKYCLRKRGVIDSDVGTRCDSFNYESSTKTCELLSISWDSTHSITSIQGSFKYYDRLEGSGCWLTQSECRRYPSLNGTFEVFTDANGDDINWEYQCMAQAKHYHENLCDGQVTNTTSVFWGGTDGQGVYDSWNPWDFTTGCVIDLSGGCYPNTTGTSRFHGTFRDSIAEDQFNAANKVDACFERAQTWNEYCNLDSSQTVSVSFPDTGAVYIYPLINCTCNEYGGRRDISTSLDFCTRNDTESYCWRPYQEDFWSYPDILCSDLSSGSCPEYDSSAWEESSHCYLTGPSSSGFLCDTKVAGSFELVEWCPDLIKDDNDDCDWDLFNVTHCELAAQHFFDVCENDVGTAEEQAVTFYLPTGDMFVYPNWEEPQENTLIKGLDKLLGYTKSDTSEYGSVSIGTGRWMSVYNGATVSRTLRQIDIWYEHDESASLTMTLYKGEGVTGSVKLETTSVGEYGPTASGGEYIHFVIDNVELDASSWYTWQVTSTNGNNDDGFIGFGLDYSNGVGDLTWDYGFVMWVENWNDNPGALQLDVNSTSTSDPWFEPLFITGLVLLGLWIIFLIAFNINRKRQERKEKEEERKRQQEIKRRARQKAMARNEQDEEYYDDDDNKNDALLDSDDDDDNQMNVYKDEDDDDDDDDDDRLMASNGNKHGVIEEDDDDAVVTTKGKA